MKKNIIILLVSLFTKYSFGQTNSIVGAWYWSDSTKAVSLFFDKDGGCSKYSGPKGEVTLSKNTKKGTYSYTGNTLTIKWESSEVETNALKFIDDNTIQVAFPENRSKKQRKQVFVFSRIVDEATFEK